MDVVRALADRIIVLHNGELLADGDPDEVMASQIVRDVYLGTSVRRRMSLADRSTTCTPISANTPCCMTSRSTVPEGGVFVLLGRNGAGKTTTLRSIMGLWRPSPGSVRFRGQDITGLSHRRYRPARHRLRSGKHGRVRRAHGRGEPGARHRERHVRPGPPAPGSRTCSRRWSTFWTKQAWALSGGQKQMLAVARAIIEPRALILVDEPTKGLAPVHRRGHGGGVSRDCRDDDDPAGRAEFRLRPGAGPRHGGDRRWPRSRMPARWPASSRTPRCKPDF